MQKATLTLRLNSTTGRKQRMAPDLNGCLYALHLANVSLTSDVWLDIYRSSSTNLSNRIYRTPCPHGTTSVTLRPRFLSHAGGSTGWQKKNSTAADLAMIEFADQPLFVNMSSAAAAKGTTLVATLTAYYVN
jgi:hypothetical protein